VLLTGAHFQQCSEYWVMCINVSVIHMKVNFIGFVYVVLLVFKRFTFCVLIMSILFAMVPCICPMFNI
jgi:hypothetical protein